MLINEHDRREILQHAQHYAQRHYDQDVVIRVMVLPIGLAVTIGKNPEVVSKEFKFYTIGEAIRYFKEH